MTRPEAIRKAFAFKYNLADFGYYCKKKGGGYNSKNNFSHRGVKHQHKYKK